jgi:hypothetical protein
MNSTELISILKTNQAAFARVIPFDTEKDKLSTVDLSNNNKELAMIF